MRTNHFSGCYTADQIRNRWRDLCKLHHPDVGGDLATMQDVNAQYESALRDDYSKTMDADEAEEAWGIDKDIMQQAQKVIGLQGIVVELIGRWIWLTGNTYPAKDTIKGAGFRWAAKKFAWYWHRPGDAPGRHRPMDLESIRTTHGSRILAGESYASHRAIA